MGYSARGQYNGQHASEWATKKTKHAGTVTQSVDEDLAIMYRQVTN